MTFFEELAATLSDALVAYRRAVVAGDAEAEQAAVSVLVDVYAAQAARLAFSAALN